jgi:hypothetical protein
VVALACGPVVVCRCEGGCASRAKAAGGAAPAPLPSERCASPCSSVLLHRRRLAGCVPRAGVRGLLGGAPLAPALDAGWELEDETDEEEEEASASVSGSTSRCLRFMTAASNHGWRMCVEDVQVWQEAMGTWSGQLD